MSSREGRKQVAVEIPIETYQEMKDAESAMWEIVDEGARIVLGLDEGSTEAALENRLNDVRQERTEIENQFESLESRLDDLESMEADLTDQLESVRQKKETHRERLDAILDAMADDQQNRPVIAWMEDLRDASTHEYGSESKENIRRVIEDLRNRAAEEMYAISPHRLTRTGSVQGQNANADGGDDSDLRVLSDGGESNDE